MSVTETMARIAEIQSLLNPRSAAPAPASTTATAASMSPSTFASMLTAQGGSTGLPAGTSALMATPTATGVFGLPAGTTGQRMVQIAQAEIGQAEQPPGSNDSPRIAEYRTATAGSGVGPWCAYFTSWVAQQAGVPVGEAGQGFGAVASVADWAQRTGRFIPPGTQQPQPGDLIVWGGRHIGIVESVGVDGSINTIEGNSSNAVSRRTYGPDGGGATGYVRLG
ncbi:MAG TPA: CHAP domain-containing protein [Capillimicrobium sp.]|nr:CHAP domain-containing protein [Capillimicrobium sp.]